MSGKLLIVSALRGFVKKPLSMQWLFFVAPVVLGAFLGAWHPEQQAPLKAVMVIALLIGNTISLKNIY